MITFCASIRHLSGRGLAAVGFEKLICRLSVSLEFWIILERVLVRS